MVLLESPFSNKVAGQSAGLRPATLLKKRFWHRCFPVNSAKNKISKNTFFYRTPLVAASVTWRKDPQIKRQHLQKV